MNARRVTRAAIALALMLLPGCSGGDGEAGEGVASDPVTFTVGSPISVQFPEDDTTYDVRSVAVADGRLWAVVADVASDEDFVIHLSTDDPDDSFIASTEAESSAPRALDADGGRMWAIDLEDEGSTAVISDLDSGVGFSLGDMHGRLTRVTPGGWFTFSTYGGVEPTATVGNVNGVDDLIELADEDDPRSFADNLDAEVDDAAFDGLFVKTLDLPYAGVTSTAQTGDTVLVAAGETITIIDTAVGSIVGTIGVPDLSGETLLAASDQLVAAAAGRAIAFGPPDADTLDGRAEIDGDIAAIAAIGSAVLVVTADGRVLAGNPASDAGLTEVDGATAEVTGDPAYAIGTGERTFYVPNSGGGIGRIELQEP